MSASNTLVLKRVTLCNSDISEGPRKEWEANKVAPLSITSHGKAIRGDLGLFLNEKPLAFAIKKALLMLDMVRQQ